MDFRWKNRGGDLPQVQPNFVDPQGVRVAMAQQQMAGYQPNPQTNMQGYSGAPTRTPMVGNPGSGEGYQFDASSIDAFNEKKRKLEQLKASLADIDAQIAEVQRQDVEQDVAARLASIGELGLYQQLLSQRQNAEAAKRSAAQGIENELYNAEKLTWGLDAKSDEDRKMVKTTIEASLRRAEEQAAKSGVDIEKNPSYRRLRSALEDSDKASIVYESEARKANEWWSKARKNELTNDDIAEIEGFIEKNPNSKAASDLRPLVEQYKPETKESRATREKRKQEAWVLNRALERMSTEDATKRIGDLSAYERKLLKDFYPEMLK